MGYGDLKELFKDAKNFAEGANNLQLKNHLLEIQNRMYELADENRNLRLQLEEEKRNKDIASELEYRENSYFLKDKGPYCTNCWDVKKNLVRKFETKIGFEMRQGEYKCPNCKTIA